MTETEALATAQAAARYRQLKISRHAKDRMTERGISVGDVEHAVLTAERATRSDEYSDRFELDGLDLENERVRVVVAIQWNTTVVAVYGL